MPWGAVIGAVGTIASSAISSSSASSAANKQADAAKAAAAQERADRKPWLDAGTSALGTLSAGLAPGGKWNTDFTSADATNSDAEKFTLGEGLGALNNSAAAKGQLLGTNNQQDNIKYAEGVASTFQNQAFNQWLAQQNKTLGATQSLAGVGQTEAGQVADASANAILAAGGARAGADAAQGNIWGSAVSSLGNTASGYLGKLFGADNNPYTTPKADGSYSNPAGSGVGVNSNTTTDTGTNVWSGNDFGMSDERLKEDIVRIGKTDDGLPIYRYRMKGGGRLQMGVMAQDVEKVKPNAVARNRHGFKMVDYAEVT